jgi:hypothetical protein
MNVDKNLIRHWAYLFESEEMKKNGEFQMEESDEKLEVLKRDGEFNLFDMEKFEFPLGFSYGRPGFVSMFYGIVNGTGSTDGNRFKKELDEFFDAIDEDVYSFTDCGDGASPQREERVFEAIKNNPAHREAFIKLISDMSNSIKDGETVHTKDDKYSEIVTRNCSGTPKFIVMFSGFGLTAFLDSMEGVYKFYMKTAYGTDSAENYRYEAKSGYEVVLVSEKTGNITHIYLGDDEEHARSVFEEIKKNYPPGHSDYYNMIKFVDVVKDRYNGTVEDIGVSEQEGEELLNKYNVEVPVDTDHPVYKLSR